MPECPDPTTAAVFVIDLTHDYVEPEYLDPDPCTCVICVRAT
jgi:hypothetical protein